MILLSPLALATIQEQVAPIQQHWAINTSNPGKLKEFERLFAKYNVLISATKFDLDEIKADPITVAVHKASQLGDNVLIEDTSLDVEGADVGINVRWLLDNLADFEGKRAVWRVLLAYQRNDQIFVYEGEICGTIVKPRGVDGFGFDPVFLPDGSEYTLAQAKPDETNARAKAVEALLTGEPVAIQPPIKEWTGSWQ
ncbi:MAG: non-canonical purine NTP pyrophosphatase [Verrucomicrobia bacterium]|nr:non-canonical purine NTP pyrophosphatase [Verrucomicrobiota bacterium]